MSIISCSLKFPVSSPISFLALQERFSHSYRYPKKYVYLCRHVMLHKDLIKLEATQLSTLFSQLLRRGEKHKEAASFMRACIPEFVFAYISPNHVRDRAKELWATLRNVTLSDLMAEDGRKSPPRKRFSSILSGPMGSRNSATRRNSLEQLKDRKGRRRLSVASGSEVSFNVNFHSFDLFVPGLHPDGSVSNGEDFLIHLSDELAEEQEAQNWKVTLAQKRIGGDENAENGAHVLTSGKLRGDLLRKLVDEITAAIQNLRQLTWPDEKSACEMLKEELFTLRTTQDVTRVSKKMDSFVGSAITKNYIPGKARFDVLRKYGALFRETSLSGDDECLYLSDGEVAPARFLGSILERGTSLSRVFVGPPSSECVLDHMEGKWLDVLEQAFSLCDNPSAVEQIWTCGLTDAGLHNTFLSETRGLEMFDLGRPNLMPIPAFLTKFLMSFFHTSGMEESSSCQGWVIRFQVVHGRLDLTPETGCRIPYLYDCYSAASDQFIEELFNGDERVRRLLVTYVVLQLLSDAAFCLQRWETKGGGTERYGDRVDLNLEKWLWRSIWDLFIASHVFDRLVLE